jgi:cellulose synthase/poly-beta-1,6-N-acetylglucosamine synthase-like glycosyltransferase
MRQKRPERPVLADYQPGGRRRRRRVARGRLVLFSLVPIIAIAAFKASQLLDDPVLGIYGVAITTSIVMSMFLAFVCYRDPALTAAPLPADPPLVSFLIPVKNEIAIIEDCVQSVLQSSYPNLELVVVDDGSTDGTTELLERMATIEPRLNLIALADSVGKKRALVRAAQDVSGEFFAFTDSDCVLAPDALERCIAALLADPSIGAVSGHARALNAEHSLITRTQDAWYDGQFAISKAAESVFGTVCCVSGPLAVYRREAIYNYLPAWANDRFAGGEFPFATDRQLTGYVLSQRWKGRKLKERYADHEMVRSVDYPERNWRVVYVESARVWTEVPPTLRAFFKQQVRWKKSFIRSLFFNGPYYWRRGPGPSLLYYPHGLWVVAAPLMAFRHLVWLPVFGAWALVGLYLAGVMGKGLIWAAAYKVRNPGCSRWKYRPVMSLLSALTLSWLIVYSAFTIRRRIWHRPQSVSAPVPRPTDDLQPALAPSAEAVSYAANS